MKTCKMGCGKMSVGGVKPKGIKKMSKGGMAAGIPYMAGGPTDSKNGRMQMGGSKLKPVPEDKTGLSKLPKSVRNKMGYMKIGGFKKK